MWTYGATLVEALVPDRRGRRENVTLRLPSLAAYEDWRSRYVGATLGRYARCIARGELRLDGRVHRLTRNEGRHHIHGGEHGFDRFVWDAEPRADGDAQELVLRLERPAGDEGYPGAVAAQTTYRLDADGVLTLAHGATATAPTVVEMTNHAYWNLSGAGTVDGHRLAIAAARVLLVDDELIPVGDPVAVDGTPFDRRAARPLGADRLDTCFALDGGRWAARLEDPASGRAMTIATDQPGLQVYTGDHLGRAGICLQTGGWPDAPGRPGFPSPRLDPGGVYRHVTTHAFDAA